MLEVFYEQILNEQIFIDLKKIFDTIDHKIYCKHLLNMGWIKMPWYGLSVI